MPDPSTYSYVATFYMNKRRMESFFHDLDEVLAWAKSGKLLYGTPASGAASVFSLKHVDGRALSMEEALTILRNTNIPAYHKRQRQLTGRISFPLETGLVEGAIAHHVLTKRRTKAAKSKAAQLSSDLAQ